MDSKFWTISSHNFKFYLSIRPSYGSLQFQATKVESSHVATIYPYTAKFTLYGTVLIIKFSRILRNKLLVRTESGILMSRRLLALLHIDF